MGFQAVSRGRWVSGKLILNIYRSVGSTPRADVGARPARRPRLLRAEDEAEIEETFRQLRTADQADRATSSDDVSDA